MDEIIKSITQAETEAKLIKQQALDEALIIAEKAEVEAADIAKANEAECKLLRERELARAEKEGEENYLAALEKKRVEASSYADGILKKETGMVSEIVRRITRGSC